MAWMSTSLSDGIVDRQLAEPLAQCNTQFTATIGKNLWRVNAAPIVIAAKASRWQDHKHFFSSVLCIFLLFYSLSFLSHDSNTCNLTFEKKIQSVKIMWAPVPEECWALFEACASSWVTLSKFTQTLREVQCVWLLLEISRQLSSPSFEEPPRGHPQVPGVFLWGWG